MTSNFEVRSCSPVTRGRAERVRRRRAWITAAASVLVAALELARSEGAPVPELAPGSVPAAGWEADAAPEVRIQVTPGSAPGAARVRVEWCDDGALQWGTGRVALDGDPAGVVLAWRPADRAGCASAAVSDGEVRLAAGVHLLEASICDRQGRCGSDTAHLLIGAGGHGARAVERFGAGAR